MTRPFWHTDVENSGISWEDFVWVMKFRYYAYIWWQEVHFNILDCFVLFHWILCTAVEGCEPMPYWERGDLMLSGSKVIWVSQSLKHSNSLFGADPFGKVPPLPQHTGTGMDPCSPVWSGMALYSQIGVRVGLRFFWFNPSTDLNWITIHRPWDFWCYWNLFGVELH